MRLFRTGSGHWFAVRRLFVPAAIALIACTSLRAYDLVIRNGRVIDGTGNPAVFADVGIENGRIAAVGRITNESSQVIDATGLVITPGFIDVHTHAEEIVQLPSAGNFVRM